MVRFVARGSKQRSSTEQPLLAPFRMGVDRGFAEPRPTRHVDPQLSKQPNEAGMTAPLRTASPDDLAQALEAALLALTGSSTRVVVDRMELDDMAGRVAVSFSAWDKPGKCLNDV